MTQTLDPSGECDLAVVGAGILGLAAARELKGRHPGLSVRVLDKEDAVARHQTGRNSGVIHAGIYYTPGSLKAKLCVEGARAMYEYLERNAIPFERCGKTIVARDASELPALAELERRGRANRVPGLRRVDADGLRELEPHAAGVAALHSPATGIVDFAEVARRLARDLEEGGTQVHTGCEVRRVVPGNGRIALHHSRGELRARHALFCAGLASDRLAIAAGGPPEPRIVPFRGGYLHVKPERRDLVRALIYPVPDARLPFLGVHLSRHIDGSVSIGPTALLVGGLGRRRTWRLARRFWRTGITELRHAMSRRALAAAAAQYVPELTTRDVEPGPSGVRAQAVASDGSLLDDFVFSDTERAVHVRNAPSPAATSSFAIARLIADRAEDSLRLTT
jgi:(S)-2-hydroxyglutarate dehydrogenase